MAHQSAGKDPAIPWQPRSAGVPPSTWSHAHTSTVPAISRPPLRTARGHSEDRISRSRTIGYGSTASSFVPPWGFHRGRDGEEGEEGLDNWQTLRLLFDNPDRENVGFSKGLRGTRSLGGLRSVFQDRLSVRIPSRSRSPGGSMGGSVVASPTDLQPPEPLPRLNGSTVPAGADHFENFSETEAVESTPLLPTKTASSKPMWTKVWPLSPVSIAVLKCSIAYLLASLFTFVPILARLLTTTYEEDAHGRISRKPAFSAHMVATVVIYFNPAKSAGNMLLADRYCLILTLIATGVCLASMFTLHLFDRYSPAPGAPGDWISEMGDWVVCLLWIGGSMGVLAWGKVYVGNPVFNAGCSMAAITIFSVVIKEGNIPKLAEILLIVLSGVVCSNLVCFTIFPNSATTRLQTSIHRSITSFSTLLDLLSSTFLLQKSVVSCPADLREAIAAHGKAFKTLQADLADAKHERPLDGRIRGRKVALHDTAISSLGRLAQHLSGMRGSIRLQESLLKAIKEGKLNADVTRVMDLTPDAFEGAEGEHVGNEHIRRTVKIFRQFRSVAGSQMEALVDRCQEGLSAIQSMSLEPHISHADLGDIQKALEDSLHEFSSSSSKAIKRLYAGPRRRKEVYDDWSDFESDASEKEGDKNEDENELNGPNEMVFQMYFFLFTLEEFALELLALLNAMTDIAASETLTPWNHLKCRFTRAVPKEGRTYLSRTLQKLVPVDPSTLQPPPFPSHQRTASGTLSSPPDTSRSRWKSLRSPIWRFGNWLSQPTQKYAIKVWLAGALLAVPAYTEWGRETFLEYRMEWALIAYFSTMSPTLGQTNHMSFSRAGGTFIGAFFGMVAYSLFPNNPVILAIVGFLFAMPCFYVITQLPEAMQTGRFTLLGYNLVCLYAYNKRDRGYPVFRIMIFRSLTVVIGVMWTAVVSRYWWPYTARRELRMGLSDFCLDLSYLYSKLVATYSQGLAVPVANDNIMPDEHTSLVSSGGDRELQPTIKQFLSMELHLRSQLTTLRSLLAQTKNEPRLKGPFPTAFYNNVLLSLERILDKLHSMRCVSTRTDLDQSTRRAFVVPVNRQLRELAGNVILFLYILSAGFHLRTPLPPYFPPAEASRQDLVTAMRELDIVKRRSVRGSGKHLLYFAYALAMQEVIAEMEHIGGMVQDAFGVIAHSSTVEFEGLFESAPETLEVQLGVGGFLYREER